MKIGELDVSKIYLGSAEIEKIYLGTEDVYESGDTPTPPAPSYDTQYFTTESTSDNNIISFTMGTGMTTATTTAVTSVSVSTDDGATWTSMENIGANASLSVTLDAGEKAIWKGVANGYSEATATTRSTIFSSTGDYKVYGNILSLLYGDDFEEYTHTPLSVSNSLFTNLFNESAGLTDASNLVMDFYMNFANTSARPFAYMFKNCISLRTAPELKDIEFSNSGNYIFRNMFQGCFNLQTAPELPATTLAQGCYSYMFKDCINLETAPVLSATTLAPQCYRNMFEGCTSLNYIKCLATDISASNCTNSWVTDVASSGTFVKAASMSSWTTGVNGIPDGWTVIEE